ncbi:hypothetical protein BS78_01G025200 [Paspalum vaginatum]|uniref:GRF-type domain-containing protein n=1 Tax=Paspalum vaginatum TaxID=158149 RepID=A0A9W7X8F1_9POAL|nr:hypothetical protein BS78_K134000 [Paspalum vaginatum]KAJ1292894.1 hypothetical protein BS78_01G025200 [Paspalum vaginatum]
MASHSSVASQRRRRDYPLITCTNCGRHTVLERIVQTNKNGNKGRIFYVCPGRKADGSGCPFWHWEESYVNLLKKEAAMSSGQDLGIEVNREDPRNKEKEDWKIDNIENEMRALVGIGKEVVVLLKWLLVVGLFVLLSNIGWLVCRN